MTDHPKQFLADHGTHQRYHQGCTCDPCRLAANEDARTRRWRRRANRVNGVATDVAEHGAHAYSNAHCRCGTCVVGHREQIAEHKARRLAARELIDGRLVAVNAAAHGKSSTYNNHGCRCQPCTDASTADRHGRVAPRREAS